MGGDLQVASFNVLNYFTTLGEDLEGCTYYDDRFGDPVTVNRGCDARGAAEQEDFERQQAKIVEAINALGAEVVSLSEIENSARFGQDRDVCTVGPRGRTQRRPRCRAVGVRAVTGRRAGSHR